jgi:exodeoxyribonuclease V alpha subunit
MAFLTVEKQFALALLQKNPASEASLQFAAYLLAATRRGHLHVKVSEGKISPSPKELFPEGGVDEAVLLEGASLLAETQAPIVKEGEHYYLQRFHRAEKKVKLHWNRLQESAMALPIEHARLEKNLTELRQDHLTREQHEAIERGCRSSPFILTGGPGSGKTYTAGKLLSLLQEGCGKEYFLEQTVLAAPTGKAALALQNSLVKSLGETSLKAQTLHALLGLSPTPRKSTLPLPFLPYSIFVVDEASMIDIELMEELLSRIRSGAFLLLIGDPKQLPPVEGPPIFPQLVQCHIHKKALKECKRVESLELLAMAERLAAGEPIEKVVDVKRLDNERAFQKLLEEWVMRFAQAPEENSAAFAFFRKFKILTPYRHTKWGSEAINLKIFKALQKRGEKTFPLVLRSNDYELGYFNGDSALLKKDRVVFENGEEVPASLLSSYELGYASTIHKSQGSEYEEVALLLPRDAVLSQAVLYTAVTRSRKKIIVLQF